VTATLNLVVTCTERKTLEPSSNLRVHSLRQSSVAARCNAWIRNLRDSADDTTKAIDLYTGNHWYVVKRIAAGPHRSGLRLQVWVASAGYGLIPIAAPLHPYAATFSPGRDSVGDTDACQTWWHTLGTWQGPVSRRPRSIRELAASYPASPLLIVASPFYVRAMAPDILASVDALRSGDQLSIISAGLRGTSELASHLAPADSRHQHIVGGQMHSLNARLAEYAIAKWTSWEGSLTRLSRMFQLDRKSLPERVHHSRAQQSTAQLAKWIRAQRRIDPSTGHSTLLRRLRASGMACEQKRFKSLFLETTQGGSL
jgi:hypothetical protein